MITITDRKYKTLCQLPYDLPKGLAPYDDTYEQDLESGMSFYEFVVDKSNEDVGLIVVGSYVMARDGDIVRTFEITETDEDNTSKRIYCSDAGLDLIGEVCLPYNADKGYPITHYFNKFTADSGWQIGLNEVSTFSRKLEWDGTDTAIKRLKELAGRFDCEISYTIELDGQRATKKLVNFHKRIGKDKKVRLEYGSETTKIRKRESIENLATGLIGRGENNLTLHGYSYDDGRYYLRGMTLVDRVEGKRWSRHHNTDDGYIVKVYDSQAKTQKALLDETLLQLKKRNVPEVTYEVDIELLPETVNIGDTVTIVDHEYKPKLIIEARVSKLEKSLITNETGVVTITNVVEVVDNLDERVRQIASSLQERLYDWNSVPIMCSVDSSNGQVFKDGLIHTTLTASATKSDIDVSVGKVFNWRRVSKNSGNADTTWNNSHKDIGKSLVITIDDVDSEATFYCDVVQEGVVVATDSIVIKDLVVGQYTGSVPPTNVPMYSMFTNTDTGKRYVLYPDGWKDLFVDIKVEIADKADKLTVKDIEDKLISQSGNLLLNSNESWTSTAYMSKTYRMAEKLQAGQTYTFVIDWQRGGGVPHSYVPIARYNGGSFRFMNDSPFLYNSKLKAWMCTFTVKQVSEMNEVELTAYDSSNYNIHLYRYGSDEPGQNNPSSTAQVSATFATLVKGGIPLSDWQPHYSETQKQIDDKADSNLTQEQLNMLQEKNALLRAELEAKASLEAINEIVSQFEAWVAGSEEEKRQAELNLIAISNRLVAQENNYGAMSEKWNFIDRDIQFGDEGIRIGNPSQNSHLLISDNRISMFSGGLEVMYVTQGLLYINRGVFVESLQIKNFEIGGLRNNPNILGIRRLGN